MCLTLAISTWRLEKYLARTMTSASFAKSAGCRENSPKDIQLFEPFNAEPIIKTRMRPKTAVRYMATTTGVFLIKRKSIKLNARKTAKEMSAQTIWREKNVSVPLNEYIVRSPPRMRGRSEPTRIQSMESAAREILGILLGLKEAPRSRPRHDIYLGHGKGKFPIPGENDVLPSLAEHPFHHGSRRVSGIARRVIHDSGHLES